VGSESIGAGMFTTVVGYTFPVKDLSPRAYFEFDYASGDKKRGGSVGTFNQLYPNGHAFLGYIDYIGRQNIISPNTGFGFSRSAILRFHSSNIFSGARPIRTLSTTSPRP